MSWSVVSVWSFIADSLLLLVPGLCYPPAPQYALPKVHKVNLQLTDDHLLLPQATVTKIPLRPINSCIGSPTYELSKYLASILKLLQNNEYSVKNAKEYADFVNNQTIEADEQIVSFDVTALFTSIKVDLALDIVAHTTNTKPDYVFADVCTDE